MDQWDKWAQEYGNMSQAESAPAVKITKKEEENFDKEFAAFCALQERLRVERQKKEALEAKKAEETKKAEEVQVVEEPAPEPEVKIEEKPRRSRLSRSVAAEETVEYKEEV